MSEEAKDAAIQKRKATLLANPNITIESQRKRRQTLQSKTDDEKQKTVDKLNWTLSLKSPEERLKTRQKQSESKRRGKAYQAIPVKCITTGEVFDCMVSAYNAHHISKFHLRDVIKNKRPDKNGNVWIKLPR